MPADHYATLGVRHDATPEEIKKAYRRLARELHPDVNPDPKTQERFKDVTAAYEVLSDPEKRSMFDLGGDPLSASGGSPFGAGFGGFSDIMDAFFGAGGTQRGPRSRIRQGADALIRLDLQLSETAFGATKDISIETADVCPTCTGSGCAPGTHPDTCVTCRGRGEVQSVQRSFLGQVMTSRPCPACGGTGSRIAHPCPECATEGRVRTRKTITVTIPSGVEDGMRIRLSGQGEVGQGGGPPGDLYVEVHERDHPVFTREGADLHCKVTLPMTAAALGTRVALETLDGEVTVDVRAGTQSGAVETLRNRGVPRLSSEGRTRGDLHVHVEVLTPTRLDADQEQLLRDLARLRDEEMADAVAGPVGGSGRLFSRLRDAFGGR